MKSRLYFPGLNGVRFLAALLVVIDHTDEFKAFFSVTPAWSGAFSAHLGAFGVTVFFSLSGYLITHLMLVEAAISGTISIRKFYVRRILRIWPIYYLLTALAFFVLPHIDALAIPNYSEDVSRGFVSKLVLFLGLLPNVAFVYLPNVPFANVLWSVGVEEQFYLFWPWLVRGLRRPVVSALLVFAALKALALVAPDKSYAVLLFRSRFSCMLIGAGSAYMLFHDALRVRRVVFHPLSQATAWIGLALLLILPHPFRYPFSVLQHEVIAVLTALVVVNVSQNERTLVRLENATFNYLGKLSYGIYVYHLIAVVISIKLLQPLHVVGTPNWGWHVAVHTIAFALSVLLAHVSYYAFEARILRMKERFSTLISGDLAADQTDAAPRQSVSG